ncbi:hypothetical protein [Halarcobacter sp.]|uniref:hypothetical protein n=1 Tax=Halarcobacter sp. TaxID=2321133 RepID=UPI003B00A91B
MNLLNKKCDVCNTKINKLQNISNIYLLKTGVRLKCPTCGMEYKTSKVISIIGYFYIWSGVSLITLILVVSFIDSFNYQFGIEVWLYGFILLSILEFIIMVTIPLKKDEGKGIKDS